jgi:hypothetical protein
MRNVTLTCVWLAICLSACKLDTVPSESTGSDEPGATQCTMSAPGCDSGVSSTPDAMMSTEPGNTPVMTGRVDSGVMNTGGAASSAPDAAVPPPPPKKIDGESCAADTDCVSAHCLHDICCTGGDCCLTATDCPMNIIDGQQVACNEPSTCQGKRGAIRCEGFLCIADGNVPDDSACTSQHLAKDCGAYKPVYCSGLTEQEEPQCATSCESDSACIEAAHCDALSSTCVMDVQDGGECVADGDCASSHCNRNLCCKAGDCCTSALACWRYASPPMCVDEDTCAGTEKVAVCRENQCTNEEMPNPMGCENVVVERCGLYPDVRCVRGVRARCATSCQVDSQCKQPDAYCKQSSQGGTCEPKLKDGEACMSSSQCQSTCNHGFCCNDSNPDTYCCGGDEDCRVLERAECVPDITSCDGRRVTATCSNDHRCNPRMTPDPNACTMRTVECGPGYPGGAACPLGCGCTSVQDCAPGYVCQREGNATRGTCVPDPGTPPPPPPPMGGAGAGGSPP